jgi:hypothetical protein
MKEAKRKLDAGIVRIYSISLLGTFFTKYIRTIQYCDSHQWLLMVMEHTVHICVLRLFSPQRCFNTFAEVCRLVARSNISH